MRIAIIGAGIGGLATAARLAARGHEVDVFEANDYPGGKLSEFTLDGYRFDAGPSLFTMPMYVDELFESAGENPRDHFSYLRAPIVCQYHWDDGARLSAWSDPAEFDREAVRQLGVPEGTVLRFLAKSKLKYELSGRIFLEKSLHRFNTWWSAKVAKALLYLPALDLNRTMHAANARGLKNDKLVQLFDRFATYNGSNPYRAPGMLTIIPHFEHGFGAYYPKGGMYAITKSVYALAERKGAKFHFNTPVERILVKDGAAVGIQVNGETRHYDQVVSNMDIYPTYKRLLPDQQHPERTLAQERSTSALIFYWGINAEFPELHLHNIFFSKDYKAEFEAHSRGEVCSDPTVYINITTKYDPQDAPPGCETWFVMVNVPANSTGQDWDALTKRIRRQVLDKLSHNLGRPIEPLIACEATLDPRSIESKTASWQGALYGTASNNMFSAFLRHPNFSSKIKNLYFVGGSVHPGGGIPLCLLSAKITDGLIAERV